MERSRLPQGEDVSNKMPGSVPIKLVLSLSHKPPPLPALTPFLSSEAGSIKYRGCFIKGLCRVNIHGGASYCPSLRHKTSRTKETWVETVTSSPWLEVLSCGNTLMLLSLYPGTLWRQTSVGGGRIQWDTQNGIVASDFTTR